MKIEVDPGFFVETSEARVSVAVEDNASNIARVWLTAGAARKFADDLLAAVKEITPDHSILDREDCLRVECITHGEWNIGG